MSLFLLVIYSLLCAVCARGRKMDFPAWWGGRVTPHGALAARARLRLLTCLLWFAPMILLVVINALAESHYAAFIASTPPLLLLCAGLAGLVVCGDNGGEIATGIAPSPVHQGDDTGLLRVGSDDKQISYQLLSLAECRTALRSTPVPQVMELPASAEALIRQHLPKVHIQRVGDGGVFAIIDDYVEKLHNDLHLREDECVSLRREAGMFEQELARLKDLHKAADELLGRQRTEISSLRSRGRAAGGGKNYATMTADELRDVLKLQAEENKKVRAALSSKSAASFLGGVPGGDA